MGVGPIFRSGSSFARVRYYMCYFALARLRTMAKCPISVSCVDKLLQQTIDESSAMKLQVTCTRCGSTFLMINWSKEF